MSKVLWKKREKYETTESTEQYSVYSVVKFWQYQSIVKEVYMIGKPSEKEDEYFARLEFERRKKEEEDRQGEMAEEEKSRLKELHYMHCPKCGMNLIEIDYRGIKVDKCSSCSGIWLDAGELELIDEREKGFIGKLFSIIK